MDAPTRREEQRAEDDADVVQGGGDGGQEEVLLGVEDALENAADAEQDEAEQENAHQLRRQLAALGVEAAAHGLRDQGVGEGEDEDGEEDGDDERQGHDSAAQAVGRFLVVLLQEAAEDRDEGRAEGARCHEDEDLLRHFEGGAVSVVLPAGAEGAGDDNVAREADDLGQAVGEHDEHGRAGDTPGDARRGGRALGLGGGRHRLRANLDRASWARWKFLLSLTACSNAWRAWSDWPRALRARPR